MIIDCHCHAGIGNGLTGPWNTRAPLARYLKRAKAAGIDRTVIFPVLDQDYQQTNHQVAQISTDMPSRLIYFVAIHPCTDQNRVNDIISQAVKYWNARGIKVHRSNAPLTREICEAAQNFQLPIMYDVMGETYRIELLAREYPKVNFIIPHLGSFADDWRAHLALIDQMVRYPNVYTDTSGVRRFDYLLDAIKRAGASKILFGSDGPWLHPGAELYKIRLLKLPPTEEDLILGINLQRLCGLQCF